MQMGVGRWARGRGGTRGGAPGSPAEPGLAPSALGLATVCRSHEQLLVPVSVRLTAAAAAARRTGVGRGERERARRVSCRSSRLACCGGRLLVPPGRWRPGAQRRTVTRPPARTRRADPGGGVGSIAVTSEPGFECCSSRPCGLRGLNRQTLKG